MYDRQSDPIEAETNALIDTAQTTDGLSRFLDALRGPAPCDTNVLFVSYTRTPDELVRSWLAHVGERPPAFDFIQVGDTMRSAAASAATLQQTAHPITTVNDPTDITTLGITISESFEELANDDRHTVLYFDSLTALLDAVDDLPTAFRFLHTLVGRVQVADAQAGYLIDSAAHDAQTLATLMDLFDTHIE